MCVHACACVCMRERVCECMCMCMCVCACVWALEWMDVPTHPPTHIEP